MCFLFFLKLSGIHVCILLIIPVLVQNTKSYLKGFSIKAFRKSEDILVVSKSTSSFQHDYPVALFQNSKTESSATIKPILSVHWVEKANQQSHWLIYNSLFQQYINRLFSIKPALEQKRRSCSELFSTCESSNLIMLYGSWENHSLQIMFLWAACWLKVNWTSPHPLPPFRSVLLIISKYMQVRLKLGISHCYVRTCQWLTVSLSPAQFR